VVWSSPQTINQCWRLCSHPNAVFKGGAFDPWVLSLMYSYITSPLGGGGNHRRWGLMGDVDHRAGGGFEEFIFFFGRTGV
jgi:hypothetical protein